MKQLFRFLRAAFCHLSVVWLCAWSGCLSCSRADGPRSILPPDVALQCGDVVFRQGGGFTSHVVRVADSGGDYSHAGIVVDSAGHLLVVHAVPGEEEDENAPDRVKAEAPEVFFGSMRANIGAVARCEDSVAAMHAARTAWQVYRRGTLFDHAYDDTDTLQMYCTELVVHAYKAAGLPLIGPERHEVDLPGLHCRCIFPSDVFQSPRLRIIKTF